ncbi:MAG TPA: homoserine dehydrogenase, partial [Spirochaetota bacterium]|nr:homoserine dehydrogenase [Spirochaetota bacterium]
MKKDVKIGLIGYGTVGSGVYGLLKKNSEVIAARTGLNVSVKMICDLRADKIASEVAGTALTTNWKDIINDKEIDTVVELIGGVEPAKSMIIEALKAGKNVVTANKKLLAEAGSEIFSIVKNSKVKLGFEASVGGGIPCLDALKSGLVGNRINSVMGILNGTTNYILTRMEEGGLSFG